ncbi:MAG: MacB family efflux pump subunit [Alphaproteobacteria bacterium]
MSQPPQHDDPIVMNVPLLDIQHAQRFFNRGDNEVKALDDVSLTVHQGEYIAIMGQSGSGKTTLMNIIGCLDRLSGGSYHVLGQDVSQLDADALARLRRETFGFIFQRYHLLSNETALENVEIPAIYAGTERRQRTERATLLLEKLGMAERNNHHPNQLSGGQQQRVAIARALMNNPPLILADEPTGALDSKSGQDVMALLHDLHSAGHTIVLITHDEKVARHAERIIRLQDGKIVQEEIITPPSSTLSTMPPINAAQIPQQAELSSLKSMEEAVHMALKSLRMNLYRTALTLLGIIIGVAAVVTMLAVGTGSKQSVLDQISAMGTNLLFVRTGAPGMRSSGDIATLVPADAIALSHLPNVMAAVPGRSSRMTVRYEETDYQTIIQGVGAAFPDVRDWPVAEGIFFTERDIATYAPVALLGQTVRNILFAPDDNPIGQFIMVKNIPMQIIGTLSPKGANAFGSDQDDAVFIPYSTGLIRLFGKNFLSDITIKVADIKNIDTTQEAVRQTMLARHRVEDFNIRNMASVIATATATQDTLTLLLGVVAAISLIVGGIGVMNIMLVSVTERTREIGIRMATGARMKDIMLQFNTESVVVCAVGGVLGVSLGFALGFILQASGMRVIFSLGPPLLAFGCACATGIVFGYLPARKAAKLDPVIALSLG